MNEKFLVSKKQLIPSILIFIGLLILVHTIFAMLAVTYIHVRIVIAPVFRPFLYYGPAVLLGKFNQIAFFTNQTNILLAISTILLGIGWKKQRFLNFFFVNVILMTITFVIFWVLISWAWPWGQAWWIDYFYIFMHIFTPLFGFFILYIIRQKIVIKLQHFNYTSLYLMLYFFWLLALYLIGYFKIGKPIAVYPFAQFFRPFFYLGNNIAIIILINVLAFISFAFLPIPIILFYKYFFKISYDTKSFLFINKLKVKILKNKK